MSAEVFARKIALGMKRFGEHDGVIVVVPDGTKPEGGLPDRLYRQLLPAGPATPGLAPSIRPTE